MALQKARADRQALAPLRDVAGGNWRCHGDILGDSVEILWNFYGRIMDVLWTFYGLWMFYGISMEFLRIMDIPWEFLSIMDVLMDILMEFLYVIWGHEILVPGI